MKKLLFLILFASFGLHAQIPLEDRLVKTCQVWGFLKYFHIGPSNCTVKWDSVLMANLPAVKAATNQATFNNALQTIINAAGPMPWPNTPIPVINPSVNSNLNFSWFNDPLLTTSISSQLDTVRSRFRPHPICHVIQNGYGIRFTDDSINVYPNVAYPTNEQRLLMAFRYWNYIEYWFNSKNLMTTPWDVTLKKYVTDIDTATGATSFQLSFLRLIAGIDDTHASTTIGAHVATNYFGLYLPGIICNYVQNQVVVVRRIAGTTSQLNVGDIITKIDQVPIDTLLNQRKKYIPASNDAPLYRDLLKGNKNIFRGPQGSSLTIEFQNASGTYTETLLRTTTPKMFYDSSLYHGLPYFAIQTPNCDIGYVNMGKLVTTDINAMYSSLSSKAAIIFDMRNYPNGTGWQLTAKLAGQNFVYALLNSPSLQYPGIIGNVFTSTNSASSSPYQGNIYVLVNAETQSQAEYTTMMFQGMSPGVKVIGSQTAGADGDISIIYLPSGIKSYFSTLQVSYPDLTIAQRVGVKIDHTVTPTVQGILAGRDELVEFALLQEGCALLTDIKNNTKNTAVLYPNPAHDRLNLAFGDAAPRSISLYNSYGQLLDQQHAEGDHATISVAKYKAGVYFIEVTTGSERFRTKFVKQN